MLYGGGFGKGGVGTLSIDGATVDKHRIPHTGPLHWPIFEGLDVGGDYSTPVDDNYSSPNNHRVDLAGGVQHGAREARAQQLKVYYNLRLAAAMGYQ
jgi:hypothetical protein